MLKYRNKDRDDANAFQTYKDERREKGGRLSRHRLGMFSRTRTAMLQRVGLLHVAFLPRHPFHQLHRDDKRQIALLTKHIHDLTYLPSDTEQAVSTPVDDVVQRLYADSACGHRKCVAFKGVTWRGMYC